MTRSTRFRESPSRPKKKGMKHATIVLFILMLVTPAIADESVLSISVATAEIVVYRHFFATT